jgi:hypothetical protein
VQDRAAPRSGARDLHEPETQAEARVTVAMQNAKFKIQKERSSFLHFEFCILN